MLKLWVTTPDIVTDHIEEIEVILAEKPEETFGPQQVPQPESP